MRVYEPEETMGQRRFYEPDEYPHANPLLDRKYPTFVPMLGLGQVSLSPGSLLIHKKLNEIRKEWLALIGFPFSDVEGLQRMIRKLQDTIGDAEKWLSEPKKTTYIAQVEKDVSKQLTSYVEPVRMASSKNRIKKQITKLKGILKAPIFETSPPASVPTDEQVKAAGKAVPAVIAKPGIDIKTIAIGAAIATVVGIVLTKALKK